MSTNNDKDTNSIDGRSRSGNSNWQGGNEWQQQGNEWQQQHYLSSYPQQQQQQQQGSQQQLQQQPAFQYPSLQDQQQQQYQWFTQQQQQQQQQNQTFNPSMSGGTSAFTTTAGLSPWGRSGGSQMGNSMGGNAAADRVGGPGGSGVGVLRSSSYGDVTDPAENVKHQSQQQPKVDAQGFPLQSTPMTTAERMRGSGMQQQVGMTPSPYTTSVLPSSFGQHQQSSHQQPTQKKLKSIKEDEEDPAMLRYETRSGFDTSPMVESLALQKKKKDDEGVTFDSDVEGPTPMPPSRQHRRISSLGKLKADEFAKKVHVL
jgi:hypothetical protein